MRNFRLRGTTRNMRAEHAEQRRGIPARANAEFPVAYYACRHRLAHSQSTLGYLTPHGNLSLTRAAVTSAATYCAGEAPPGGPEELLAPWLLACTPHYHLNAWPLCVDSPLYTAKGFLPPPRHPPSRVVSCARKAVRIVGRRAERHLLGDSIGHETARGRPPLERTAVTHTYHAALTFMLSSELRFCTYPVLYSPVRVIQ